MASICASFWFAASRQLLMCCASWPALACRRPAPGPARSFKKRARRRLKACLQRARRRLKGMRGCAPNVLHTTKLGICRHKAEWAAAGTLPASHATITGPWFTRRIFRKSSPRPGEGAAQEWTNRTPISHERTSVHFLVLQVVFYHLMRLLISHILL